MGYRFLRYPEGKTKAVTFSLDDGFWFDIPVSQTLNRYGMKGTFNITGNYLDEKRIGVPDLSVVKGKAYNELPLTKDEIKEHLIGHGHEIAVHCYNHLAPGITRAIDGINEVLQCRLKLEKDFKQIIRGMAYPDSGITRFTGDVSYQKVKEYLCDLDIAYARTLEGDNDRFELPTDWHAWTPTIYQVSPRVPDFIDKFVAIDVDSLYPALRYPRLFYLWGHSFEYHTRFDFTTLENFCEKFSQDGNIWYATNIEIYDYVKAFEALRFSADGKTVYNPTLIDVWFDLDETVYKIPSGKTVFLD